MYRYCGKKWSEDDIEHIRELINTKPQAKRAELAREVCIAFGWRRINGQLSAMSCRVAMIRMARDGLITLPTARSRYRRPPTSFVSSASDPEPPLKSSIADFQDLRLEIVARGKELAQWNEFIGRYHYLGYRIMPGAQLRYFIMAGDKVLGAMGFGGAAWKVAPRDKFIGWSAEQRKTHLHLIVNQTRFLILPWVRCQNLATKSLRLASNRLPHDWQLRYGYCPVLLETFVDVTRFKGTCYKADNWIQVGLTQGRSRMDRYHAKDQPVKSIWLLPLVRDFRAALNGPTPQPSAEVS